MHAPKTVLITGCSSGIGFCAANQLHQRGYRVFAGVRKAQDKTRLEALGLKAILLDLNDSNSIQLGLESVLMQTGGTLDALINNAGFGQPGAVEDISREALRAQFEANVFGLQELTNLVIPVMRRQGYGRVVNISSILGLVAMAYRGAYCASKFALEALTDSLRLELLGSGIAVSLVEPGPVATAFRDSARVAYEQNVSVGQSSHHRQYVNLLNNMEEFKAQSRFTLTPEAVVKKLVHALESSRPRIRYYVTLPAYGLMLLKRLLPGRWLDVLLRQVAKRETSGLPPS
ncbi:MAG TPA: SDR family NAD(P)-dependent oxidoreductase [Gammaproteobacteria bacterium]|nr:SDR family NAD(P)-dependent oxidoreductase [Gammaproteobacteria bacterium]